MLKKTTTNSSRSETAPDVLRRGRPARPEQPHGRLRYAPRAARQGARLPHCSGSAAATPSGRVGQPPRASALPQPRRTAPLRCGGRPHSPARLRRAPYSGRAGLWKTSSTRNPTAHQKPGLRGGAAALDTIRNICRKRGREAVRWARPRREAAASGRTARSPPSALLRLCRRYASGARRPASARVGRHRSPPVLRLRSPKVNSYRYA